MLYLQPGCFKRPGFLLLKIVYMKETKTQQWFNDHVEKVMSGDGHVSYSGCSKILDSPLHYKMAKMNKETTKAMEEGKRFHMAVLEPDKFKETYFVLDDAAIVEELIAQGAKSPRQKKEYKAWVIEEQERNAGKEMLDAEEYAMYVAMHTAIMSNPITKPIMDALTDKEKFFSIEYDGFKIIGYIDGAGEMKEVGRFTLDLKKCADARLKKVKWEIIDRNYDMQGGLYTIAESAVAHFLIFIDKSCNITVIRLTQDSIDRGVAKLENALEAFTRCAEEDLWDCSFDFWNGGIVNI